jgi:hypothetical protein
MSTRVLLLQKEPPHDAAGQVSVDIPNEPGTTPPFIVLYKGHAYRRFISLSLNLRDGDRYVLTTSADATAVS